MRPGRFAGIAVQAAEWQHTSLPGEKLSAQLVRTPAQEVTGLNQQAAELVKDIEARFRDHHTFDVITSRPGLGVILGVEFLAATGGDMSVFGTAGRLAGFGGVAPTPRRVNVPWALLRDGRCYELTLPSALAARQTLTPSTM